MSNLKEIYLKHQDGLKTICDELTKEGICQETSYPLLLSEWAGEPSPKAMFFGKETNGWAGAGSIDGLMEAYRKFDLGRNPDEPYNSLFWQYLRKMSDKLGLRESIPSIGTTSTNSVSSMKADAPLQKPLNLKTNTSMFLQRKYQP